jgi:hypothetical protein
MASISFLCFIFANVSALTGLPVTLMNSSEISGISLISAASFSSFASIEAKKLILRGISASIGTPVL